MHEFKDALKALNHRGLGLEGVVDDTAISGYLIQPDRRSYELAELAQHHLRITVAAAAVQAGQLELDLGDGRTGPPPARSSSRPPSCTH
ncbi:DNA polymerase I [Arthrobacter sp. Hiyo8]|nr:DNA polymerase I [Arthrobacter sp. Hiyo8]